MPTMRLVNCVSMSKNFIYLFYFVDDRDHLVLNLGRAHFRRDLLQTGDGLVADHGFLLETEFGEEGDDLGLELGQEEIKGGEFLGEGEENLVILGLGDSFYLRYNLLLNVVIV
jgi:hypothetical protein